MLLILLHYSLREDGGGGVGAKKGGGRAEVLVGGAGAGPLPLPANTPLASPLHLMHHEFHDFHLKWADFTSPLWIRVYCITWEDSEN